MLNFLLDLVIPVAVIWAIIDAYPWVGAAILVGLVIVGGMAALAWLWSWFDQDEGHSLWGG
jgi:hypothetical protein